MANEQTETMRVNVTLDKASMADLVKVMAAMPTKNEKGVPVAISPADALRYALAIAAKPTRR